MSEATADRTRKPAADDRWWTRPLPLIIWVGGLVVIVGWIALRLIVSGISQVDRVQQYQLVEGLASGKVTGALRGLSPQAAPPGYAFFALPFHLVFQRLKPTHYFYVPNDGWYIAGYAALLVLGISAVLALRSVGVHARSGTELLGLTAVVGGGATLACYSESYHPGDVLTTACMLLAAVAALRDRWIWAAVALGFGLLCKQWTVVPILVLGTLFPGRARAWMMAGSVLLFAVVTAPFYVTDRHGTMKAIKATGVGPTSRSLLARNGWMLRHAWALTLEARVLPLVIVAGLCLWLYLARPTVTPTLLFTALAVAMLVRPLLDPAGYAYYSAPGLVLLAVFSRDWRWAIASLLAGVLIDACAKTAYTTNARWPAALSMLVMIGLLVAAFLRLRALMAEQPQPAAEPVAVG